MSLITVRKAGHTDTKLIAELSRTAFYDAFAKDNTKANMDDFLNNVFTTEALVAEVENDDGIFLLAYKDNESCGYARMREKNSENIMAGENAIEIARIYALQSAIGKGVGTALMQKCMDIAGEMKKNIIWLGVWENNARAISFYQKWGFEKFGEHIFQLGTDAQTDWLMKKKL
jgi:ribosomal protein S18 acetylase RimI-like enzyme